MHLVSGNRVYRSTTYGCHHMSTPPPICHWHKTQSEMINKYTKKKWWRPLNFEREWLSQEASCLRWNKVVMNTLHSFDSTTSSSSSYLSINFTTFLISTLHLQEQLLKTHHRFFHPFILLKKGFQWKRKFFSLPKAKSM